MPQSAAGRRQIVSGGIGQATSVVILQQPSIRAEALIFVTSKHNTFFMQQIVVLFMQLVAYITHSLRHACQKAHIVAEQVRKRMTRLDY